MAVRSTDRDGSTNGDDGELWIEMHRRMLRIRRFDEAATKLLASGELSGSLHTTIGQEGEVVGACLALRPDDYMVGNHRSHGHPIGKGAAIAPLMAELMGKVTGVNKGKGGSMHLADFSVGSLGETSIVGSGVPVAAGAALGCKLRGGDQVALCFFGDGASAEGAFHEGANLAAVWSLPLVLLCENNGYGQLSAASDVLPVQDVAQRAQAYGIPGIVVDGQDVLAVHEVVSEAVARARAGEGPSLVEAKTYRYDNHAAMMSISDFRDPSEIDLWRQRDPIDLHRQRLLDRGVCDEAAIAEMEQEVEAEVAHAVAFARESPEPDPADAYTDVFVDPVEPGP